ncbi:MAG: hypothetical protein GWN58_04235, partial [Anaerolineae bacterium]|nr:hypothetical protein [Anaerolineae bacterium]
ADWENACNLQTALGQAEDGDEIWVAEGVYYPGSGSDPRTITFQLESGVEIYGGFDGTETQREERDWESHPTILSGDLDQDGILDDGNAYHVVSVSSASVDETSILDGFTITGGNA